MFMLTCDESYILETKKACPVVLSPNMHLLPPFSAAGDLQCLGQKASAVTSKLALYG